MTHVQILMASYDGGAFVGAQLDSFLAQTHDDWSLVVSDDGSRDDTRALVEAFRDTHRDRDIALVEGPRRGAADNFLSLAAAARPGSAVAFADQDDVWMPQKLERAMASFAAGIDVHTGRTILAGPALIPLGESPMPPRGTSFGNALVQNVVAGNMLVLSPGAAERIAPTIAAARAAAVPFHDWWFYLAASGMGLEIHYDDVPGLHYRQHHRNVLGSHRGMPARLQRLRLLISGTYAGWLGRNAAALSANRGHLTRDAAETFARFEALRKGRAPRRRGALPAIGVVRQNATEDRLLDWLLRTGRL